MFSELTAPLYGVQMQM